MTACSGVFLIGAVGFSRQQSKGEKPLQAYGQALRSPGDLLSRAGGTIPVVWEHRMFMQASGNFRMELL